MNSPLSVANLLMDDFVQEKYGIVKIIYNQFRNAAVQEVTEEFLLPLLPDAETGDKFESGPTISLNLRIRKLSMK